MATERSEMRWIVKMENKKFNGLIVLAECEMHGNMHLEN